MTTKIAALYARTSQDKDDAFSVASQIEEMRAYAANHDLEIKYEFREEYTGTKLDRPKLNKVRALIRDRKVDVLIIFRADRLARKQHIAGYLFEEEIVPAGVELHIVTFGGRIRPGTRDVLIFNIEAALGQDERDVIVERTQRGKMRKLLGGDGHPPLWHGYGEFAKYGYEKRGKARKTRYVIVEEEARTIRRIFRLFVNERKGVSEILRLLDAEGIPPPSVAKGFHRGRTHEWVNTTVYRILREAAYTGVWYAHRRKEVDGRTITRPKEEWIRLDFPELRIIDDETFRRAQVMLDEGRRKKAPGPTNEFLMARQMKCVCGYAICVRTETNSPTRSGRYYCLTRVAPKLTSCGTPTVHKRLLDAKVWECIEELLRNPRAQLEGLRCVQEQQMEQYSDALEHMEAARHTIEECERQLLVYAEQEAEGLITRAMLRKKKTELDERAARARSVYDEYAALIDTKVLSDEEIEQTTEWLTVLGEQIEDGFQLDFADRRAIIDALNITGKWKLEQVEDGTEQVVYLSIHTEHLARVVLQRFQWGNHDVPPPPWVEVHNSRVEGDFPRSGRPWEVSQDCEPWPT
jgi:site-specific DNA recombinase